jgi:Dissimilatory sulfite reductase (desulfoviridin), alpha and beta subunits
VPGIVTVDKTVCKGCELCVAVCSKKIMVLDRDALNEKGYHPAKCINGERCIACAMCAIICPDSAIKVEKE